MAITYQLVLKTFKIPTDLYWHTIITHSFLSMSAKHRITLSMYLPIFAPPINIYFWFFDLAQVRKWDDVR
jgi:hypothetical protein